MFSLNLDTHNSSSNNLILHQIRCKYYSPHSFIFLRNNLNSTLTLKQFSLIHTNVWSLTSNLKTFQTYLLDKLHFPFSVIGVTETRTTNANFTEFNPSLLGYNFEFVPTPLCAGGVGRP